MSSTGSCDPEPSPPLGRRAFACLPAARLLGGMLDLLVLRLGLCWLGLQDADDSGELDKDEVR